MSTPMSIAALAITPLLACSVPASAAPTVDGWHSRLSLMGGLASDVAVYGVEAMWRVAWKHEALARHQLEATIGADLLRWDGRGGANGFLWDVSVTPYLRWRPHEPSWQHTFVQVGIGLHLLSHTHIDDARAFGSSLQFGERLAWGINFGAGNRYEMTLLLQHVSNGRIQEPNNGLTYFGATFGMPID